MLCDNALEIDHDTTKSIGRSQHVDKSAQRLCRQQHRAVRECEYGYGCELLAGLNADVVVVAMAGADAAQCQPCAVGAGHVDDDADNVAL